MGVGNYQYLEQVVRNRYKITVQPKICTWIYFLVLVFCISTNGMGQRNTTRNAQKINKSVLIDLEAEGTYYYKSFFQSYRGDQLILQSQIPDIWGGFQYEETEVALNDFDYIKIIEKKKSFIYSALSGLALGATSFFVVKEISKAERTRNLTLIQQTGSTGTTEGLLAGGLGFGLGVLIYDGIFNKKIDLRTNRDQAERRLRKIKL